MVKTYQNMNQYGTTTCGIIIDYTNRKYTYYPGQRIEVCHGKKVSKKRIAELLEECIESGFSKE